MHTLIRCNVLAVLVASASLSNVAANANGDCPVVAEDLRDPIGSVLTEQGNVIVSETGTFNVPNSGRLSIVSQNGTRRTLLDGLPQGTNAAGGKVDLASGASATLASFEPIKNVAGAAGPPTVEPVPTGISQVHGDLLVSLFSGAPFLPDVSRIKTVDRTSGDQADFITGLRTAIDILPIRSGADVDYLVLENNFAPVPAFPPRGAAIKRFESPGSDGKVVNGCKLDRPTSMSLDKQSGTIYVTELLRGTLVKVPLK